MMVQRLCLVSLTISNRKTSYRSLKQTAGSTSCPWTTILVLQFMICIKLTLPLSELFKPYLVGIKAYVCIYMENESFVLNGYFSKCTLVGKRNTL